MITHTNNDDLLAKMNEPLVAISEKLHKSSFPWLVGGSTGCLLQYVPLEHQPRDLDIYTDHIYIRELSRLLKQWETHPVRFSETSMYRSHLFNAVVCSVQVELVADLTVRTAYGEYHVNIRTLSSFANSITCAGQSIKLMPLEHEFLFNILRNRPDRYQPIAKRLRQTGICEPLWRQLRAQNSLSDEFWEFAAHYVTASSKVGKK